MESLNTENTIKKNIASDSSEEETCAFISSPQNDEPNYITRRYNTSNFCNIYLNSFAI